MQVFASEMAETERERSLFNISVKVWKFSQKHSEAVCSPPKSPYMAANVRCALLPFGLLDIFSHLFFSVSLFDLPCN